MPDTHVVLLGSVLGNRSEFGLEVQGISHLVEEESKEEVSPVGVELEPPGLLLQSDVFLPLPALREDVGEWATDETGQV